MSLTAKLLTWLLIFGTLAASASFADIARDEPEANTNSDVDDPHRESLDDAWWTGPMLAASGATLPQGRLLLEPYIYDVTSAHGEGFGSLTYLLYGLARNFSVGMIPVVSFNTGHEQPSTAGPRLGDWTLQAQYQLTEYVSGRWLPTTSIVIQETLPTGKFDRLAGRVNEGTGAGTYTTTLALFSQMYFWLPNGRLLRSRLDVSTGVSRQITVQDDSVYGTTDGFRGQVTPGNYFLVDAASEYSITRKWVLAMDLIYRQTADTRIFHQRDSSSAASVIERVRIYPLFGVAPAVEYNWHPNFGVLLGTRLIPRERGTGATVTPAIAVNCVF